MRRLGLYGTPILLLFSIAETRAQTLMTFEEFPGYDVTPISTFYSGVGFQSGYGGSDWVARDATTNSHNTSSWPSGTQWGSGNYWIHGFVSATTMPDYSGNDGVVTFDNADATYVELGYSSYDAIHLEAYDIAGVLLDSASGAGNLRHTYANSDGPGTLRVDAPLGQYISYVYVHKTGNYWLVDDISIDASGIVVNPVPVPGAILLSAIGTSLVGRLRRRQTLWFESAVT